MSARPRAPEACDRHSNTPQRESTLRQKVPRAPLRSRLTAATWVTCGYCASPVRLLGAGLEIRLTRHPTLIPSVMHHTLHVVQPFQSAHLLFTRRPTAAHETPRPVANFQAAALPRPLHTTPPRAWLGSLGAWHSRTRTWVSTPNACSLAGPSHSRITPLVELRYGQ